MLPAYFNTHLRLALIRILLLLPLQLVYHLPRRSKQLPKPKAPPLDPHTPDKEVHQRPITDAERKEDAEVSPLLIGLNVECGEVVVAGRVGAVHAAACGVRVEEVARSLLEEVGGVCGTGLAGWCVELCGLLRSALDRDAVEGCCEDTTDPVG